MPERQSASGTKSHGNNRKTSSSAGVGPASKVWFRVLNGSVRIAALRPRLAAAARRNRPSGSAVPDMASKNASGSPPAKAATVFWASRKVIASDRLRPIAVAAGEMAVPVVRGAFADQSFDGGGPVERAVAGPAQEAHAKSRPLPRRIALVRQHQIHSLVGQV